MESQTSLAESALPSPEDHTAILDLLARYCLYLDIDDTDAWVSLFTEDGQFEAHGHTWVGPGKLARMMNAAPRGMHLGGVPSVEMIDEDRARTTQNLYLVPTMGDAPRSAFYTDELVRTDAGWRLASRRCQFLTSQGLRDQPED